MKITSVSTIGLRAKTPVISDAMSVNRARQALWVKVETDSGLYGIGEAFTYGSPLEAARQIVEQQLAPVLIGENPAAIEQLWQKMYWRNIASGRTGLVFSCIGGVDIALWDLLGKSAGLSVADLLGRHSETVPSYASGGFYAEGKGIEGLKREIEGYLDKGYRDVKIKIGRVPELSQCTVKYTADTCFSVTLDEDLERIAAVRSMIGKHSRLAADINAAWSEMEVIQALPSFKEAGLNFLEEPIQFENEAGLKRIREAMPEIGIMGFETAQGCFNFTRLMKAGAMDVVEPDVGWGGGITEVRKIAAAARGFCKPVSLHSFGSCVHFAASLQLAASLPNTEAIESEENPNPLKTGLTKTPFEHDDHMNFIVSDKPGLGLDIDWDKVEEYRVF